MKLAVGVFVIALITVLVVFFYLLLKEKGAFDKRYSYNFYAKSAAPFKVGMPLSYSGFAIGSIDDIKLTDSGEVHLIFSITQQNRKWVCTNSKLLLVKPLIGAAYIEIVTKSCTAPLKPGATLPLSESDDINDMISKLQPAIVKTIKIIDHIEKLTASFADTNGSFMHSMRNIDTFTTRMAKDKSLLTSITGDANSTKAFIGSLNDMQRTMRQVHSISVKLDKIMGGLDNKIVQPSNEALKNINVIMKDVQGKLKALDGTVNAVGSYDKDLSAIKEQLQLGLDKTNKVMEKVDALLQDTSTKKVELP